MQFIVTIQLQPGQKNQAVETFELRGPSRYPSVKFENAWISKHHDVIYVLVESVDEAHVTNACSAWDNFGRHTIDPVTSFEQF
ncbi:hypothetical protein Psta_2291 [Pirellula staleyi DSM 6068]|uniref:Uncharacterized protein n=1 Tax=Pirellula staleyi (strain ATCC 27377 / DSM 6068 / ICPB 4128) TaxID=530564 RepID=D2R3K7_PIRSD|nr:DUF3303 family protein [Pirellula staleyi]ADB16961.1 hypothetical protein Psta_2291 [Pirellula staleyi DSM 6068]